MKFTIQKGHVAGAYKGMLAGRVEKTCVDATQRSLSLYNICYDPDIQVEILEG